MECESMHEGFHKNGDSGIAQAHREPLETVLCQYREIQAKSQLHIHENNAKATAYPFKSRKRSVKIAYELGKNYFNIKQKWEQFWEESITPTANMENR